MNVLVVAPHPDDETLGCGGTLVKWRDAGHQLHWLIMTSMKDEAGYTGEEMGRREKEIAAVAARYGFDSVTSLPYGAARLDRFPMGDIIESVCPVLHAAAPAVLLVPNRGDVHSDHRLTFDAIMSCTKTFRAPFLKRIMMYETVSETEHAPALPERAFIPNAFSDITGSLDEKLAVMDMYAGQTGEHPFPRSRKNLEALGAFRGSIAGSSYAEAFMLIRDIF